jgi:OPA family sugar phosphate sensor protein UhpC-like MFS transporter
MEQSRLRLDESNPRSERWRWQILFIIWLAYVGFYLTRKSFSVAKIELAKPEVMGWNKGQIAWVDGAFLITYALGGFFWGPLGDKFGPRRVVAVGLFASVVLAFLMGASSSVVLLGLLSGIHGLCQSSGWGPLAKNLGAFFSLRERGRILGLWCTSMPAGNFVATTIAAAATGYLGWRFGFWVPAGCLLLVASLFLALQRDRPEDVGLPSIEDYHGEAKNVVVAGETAAEEPEGSWKVIAEVLSNGMVWLLALTYLLVKPTRYLIMSWAPLYVNERLGSEVFESSILGSMSELAGLISPFLSGWLSDWLFRAKRMPLSILALLGCAALWFAFGYLPSTRFAIGLGLFGIGFLIYIPETLLSGTAAIDFGTKKGASTAASLINGCGSLGALIGATIPGWIQHIVGVGGEGWNSIFLGLGMGLALAALALVPQWNRLPPRSSSAVGVDKPVLATRTSIHERQAKYFPQPADPPTE